MKKKATSLSLAVLSFIAAAAAQSPVNQLCGFFGCGLVDIAAYAVGIPGLVFGVLTIYRAYQTMEVYEGGKIAEGAKRIAVGAAGLMVYMGVIALDHRTGLRPLGAWNDVFATALIVFGFGFIYLGFSKVLDV